jgi:PAS domain S-box-containing protein
VPRELTVDTLAQRGDGHGFWRPGYPSALTWIVLAYAVAAVAIGWAYSASRIRADYMLTMDSERDRLREVDAALQSAVVAMLNDGVGAAVAGANELQSAGGFGTAPGQRVAATLKKHLTGGDYVRFLFLADAGRFVLASRDATSESRAAPPWLTVDRAPILSVTWVGNPTADPERPLDVVVPVARRVASGDSSTAWAGALLSFASFDSLYGQFRDRILTMGLVRADGMIIARSPVVAPGPAAVGHSVAAFDLFRRAIDAGTFGIVEGRGPANRDIIAAYDQVSGYPLYVVSTQGRDAALAGWRERRQLAIAATAAFSALVLVMTALLNHYILRLRRRELHYRALFNNAQFSAFLMEGTRFVDANSTAVKMFGLASAGAAKGMTPWEISPEYQPDGRRSDELARERIETALRDGGSTFEWLHKRIDTGESFPAEVNLSSLSTGGTVLALAVVHDVTMRKRAEHDLQVLSAELMRTQDEERRRIGRDLHDSTGQTLAALEMGLARLMHNSDSALPAREQFEHCARLASQCSTEIRTASYLLHPPLLDELGLLSALRWLADGFRRRSEIDVRLDLPEAMDRLPRDHELCLFRVAQEALTNVHRHAASPWASIRLKAQSNSVMLEIEDAGRGMPRQFGPGTDAHDPPLGVGLAGMRERIRQIGGTLSVESTNTGTRVRTTLSISQADVPTVPA